MKQDFNKIIQKCFIDENIQAAIFDLDGTLIDNNAFHLQTWKKYLEEMQLSISEENYRKHINGRTNKDAIEYLYNRKMTDEEAMVYALEKEAMYRQLYAPHIKPLNGLIDWLEAVKNQGIRIGMATSGILVNIEFLFEHIPIRSYFESIIHSGHISKGKPDPEIYLKAADSLTIAPEHCMVFEDAAVGVTSAKSAGMTVLALTTTQTPEELKQADYISIDFSLAALNDAFTPNWHK